MLINIYKELSIIFSETENLTRINENLISIKNKFNFNKDFLKKICPPNQYLDYTDILTFINILSSKDLKILKENIIEIVFICKELNILKYIFIPKNIIELAK